MNYGVRTLFVKEVRRFLRVPGQTVLSPLVTTALYLAVFGYALGGRLREVDGTPYLAFIVPGLVMLGITMQSFLNSSSSIIIMKVQNTMVDLLVTPLSAVEIAGAMIGASVVRGLMVGGLTWATAAAIQGEVRASNALLAIAFPVLTATAFSALGLLTGIWADKFEQVNFFPTFVLTPLVFLGGVFYDVRTLPPAFAAVSHANPILYLVEGMRYALLGRSAVDPWVGLVLLLALAAASTAACIVAIGRGWKLRQ